VVHGRDETGTLAAVVAKPAEAGRRPIDSAELDRLQRIVIGDACFVKLGLRAEGGFCG